MVTSEKMVSVGCCFIGPGISQVGTRTRQALYVSGAQPRWRLAPRGSAAGRTPAPSESYGPLSAPGSCNRGLGCCPGLAGVPLGCAFVAWPGSRGADSSSGTSGRFYPHACHPMVVIVHVHSPRLTAHLAILDIGLAWPAARIQGNGHALPAVRTGDLCLGVPGVVLLSTRVIVGIFWTVAGAKISHHEFSSSRRHAAA